MSLSKVSSKAKAGIGQLQSMTGLKKTAVHMGLGFVLGVITDLFLNYIFEFFIYPAVVDENGKLPEGWVIKDFSFFGHYVEVPVTDQHPDGKLYTEKWDNILGLVIGLVLLMSKKFWIVMGYLLGWYASNYYGLFVSLGITEYMPVHTE